MRCLQFEVYLSLDVHLRLGFVLMLMNCRLLAFRSACLTDLPNDITSAWGSGGRLMLHADSQLPSLIDLIL